jgi:hypothetical protein
MMITQKDNHAVSSLLSSPGDGVGVVTSIFLKEGGWVVISESREVFKVLKKFRKSDVGDIGGFEVAERRDWRKPS